MHFFLYFITWSRQPGNLNENFYILEKVSLLLPPPTPPVNAHIYAYHTHNKMPEDSRCEIR